MAQKVVLISLLLTVLATLTFIVAMLGGVRAWFDGNVAGGIATGSLIAIFVLCGVLLGSMLFNERK